MHPHLAAPVSDAASKSKVVPAPFDFNEKFGRGGILFSGEPPLNVGAAAA